MRRTFLGLAGAGLLAAALVAAKPAQAQTTPAIGTVDMGRINEEYQAIQQLTVQYQAFARQQQATFEERSKTRLLNDEEVKEFNSLSQFAAPTDANKQKLAELAELSNTRERRLAELEKKTRDASEQKEFDDLTAISQARGGELGKLQQDLLQAVGGKRDELQKVIQDSVNAAIKSVAEEKKLSVVIAKAVVDPEGGVAPLVLYGGTDVTDAVLAKLNTSPRPAAAAPAPTPSTPAPAAGAQTPPPKK